MKKYQRWVLLFVLVGLGSACQSNTPPPTQTAPPVTNPLQTATPSTDQDKFTPVPTRKKGPENLISLGYGQTVETAGYPITFAEVLEDSRCPSDVTCVWAGRVSVVLEVEISGGESEQVVLSQGTLDSEHVSEVEIGGILISLYDVRPTPVSTISVEHEVYIVDLVAAVK